jgi:aryl-alcohol dehydrogenase-like predicted oxidoreductase
VPRDQIWLTTKLDNPWHKRAPEALKLSLENLGVDYLDLYLMHWPSSTEPDSDLKRHYPDWDFVDTWREMQKLMDTGKIRNLGVSNFGIKNLERLLNDPSCKVRGATPLLPLICMDELLTSCRSSRLSTRSSFTQRTRPPSSLLTAPRRASTAAGTRRSAAATRRCTRTRRLPRSPRPRTAASSR